MTHFNRTRTTRALALVGIMGAFLWAAIRIEHRIFTDDTLLEIFHLSFIALVIGGTCARAIISHARRSTAAIHAILISMSVYIATLRGCHEEADCKEAEREEAEREEAEREEADCENVERKHVTFKLNCKGKEEPEDDSGQDDSNDSPPPPPHDLAHPPPPPPDLPPPPPDLPPPPPDLPPPPPDLPLELPIPPAGMETTRLRVPGLHGEQPSPATPKLHGTPPLPPVPEVPVIVWGYCAMTKDDLHDLCVEEFPDEFEE